MTFKETKAVAGGSKDCFAFELQSWMEMKYQDSQSNYPHRNGLLLVLRLVLIRVIF